MDVLGLKARLFGDILYTQVPVGIKYKKNNDFNSNFSGLGLPGTMKDVFAAYFPNKSLSLTAAYADLGPLPFQASNRGVYLSLNMAWARGVHITQAPRAHAASDLTQELSP
ncbi:DUF3034 family protein [Thiomonas sp.]